MTNFGLPLPSQKSDRFPLVPTPATAWIPIFILIAVTLLLLAIKGGRLLGIVFPFLSICTGLILYFRHPVLYVGFTWWIWFLSPLVRRLADFYGAGFSQPSTILLTPFLVTGISAITVITSLPHRDKLKRAFVLPIIATIYGYCVGLINSSFVPITVSFLGWISPILLGYHIFANWKRYPEYVKNLKSVFLWCSILVGIYGIFQYIISPEWDTFWLTNSINGGALSFGRPEPFQIRVWSTMHSPGPFSSVMAAVLLVLLDAPSPWLPIGASASGLSFLLSQGRTGWITFFLSLVLLIPSLKPRLQIRIVSICIAAFIVMIPLSTIEPFSQVVSNRISSLSSGKDDHSALERKDVYDEWLGKALTNVLGEGTGSITRGDGVVLDSGVLDILLSLGWLGGSLYIGGLMMLLVNLISQIRTLPGNDLIGKISLFLGLIMFLLLPLGSLMLGIQGVILWFFLGLASASQRYASHISKSPTRIQELGNA